MYATLKVGGDLEMQKGIPTLKDLQEAVGGLIAPVNLFGDSDGFVSAYVNDEGILIGLDLNVVACGDDATIPLYGDMIFARVDNEGETRGLTEEDFWKISEALGVGITNEGQFVSVLDFRS